MDFFDLKKAWQWQLLSPVVVGHKQRVQRILACIFVTGMKCQHHLESSKKKESEKSCGVVTETSRHHRRFHGGHDTPRLGLQVGHRRSLGSFSKRTCPNKNCECPFDNNMFGNPFGFLQALS